MPSPREMTIIAVCLLATMLLGAAMTDRGPPRKAQTTVSHDDVGTLARSAAIVDCRHDIKERLNDPASAEFGRDEGASVYRDGTTYVVRRDVRAKNAFDAFRLTTFECQYRLDGRRLTLLSVSQVSP